MNSDLLLAKPNLPDDWIDASVGEAHLVRNNLYKHFYKYLNTGSIGDMSYPDPIGYNLLVKLLEEKYNAPVIITNGAKNGLGSIFYALKKLGWNYCEMKKPYWALIPQLSTMHGINSEYVSNMDISDPYSYPFNEKGPFLLLAPNNPDGSCDSPARLVDISTAYKNAKIPLVHDSVYYNHIYLPKETPLLNIGDVQIYSASKSFGLSGTRIGWAVCHNRDFYKYIKEYMEAMTVGVSMISQLVIYNLMIAMKFNPDLVLKFEEESYGALLKNKEMVKQIDSSILDVTKDIENIPGMFLWAKVNDQELLNKAKVNVALGKHFGMPGYIRMNIAFDALEMQEIVNRINNAI